MTDETQEFPDAVAFCVALDEYLEKQPKFSPEVRLLQAVAFGAGWEARNA